MLAASVIGTSNIFIQHIRSSPLFVRLFHWLFLFTLPRYFLNFWRLMFHMVCLIDLDFYSIFPFFTEFVLEISIFLFEIFVSDLQIMHPFHQLLFSECLKPTVALIIVFVALLDEILRERKLRIRSFPTIIEFHLSSEYCSINYYSIG